MIIHNGVVQSQKTMRTQGRDGLVDKTMFALYLGWQRHDVLHTKKAVANFLW